MGSRIGSAFVLVGVIALTVYLLGTSVDQTDPGLLLAGLSISLLGLLLRRRSAARSKRQISRFQTMRRLLGGTAEEE